MALMAWDKVSRSKSNCGIGLRRIRTLNESLLSKQIWRLFYSDSEWCEIWRSKYPLLSSSLFSFINYDFSINGSHIWNHASKCKDNITKGVKWRVGNGRKVRFWEDPWLLDKPFLEIPDWAPFSAPCKRVFGSLVEGYWIGDKWQNIEGIHPGLINLKKHLFFAWLNNEEDVLIWKFEPKGNITVSSMYGVLTPDPSESPFLSKAWIKGLIPKINIFYWTILQNKILTLDNLKIRGFNFPNRCALCLKEEESMDHLVIHCSFTISIWESFLKNFCMEWVFPNSIQDLFHSWSYHWSNPSLRSLWKLSLPHILWGIWKEINTRIFRDTPLPQAIVFQKIQRAIVENLRIIGEPCNPVNCLEAHILNSWNLKSVVSIDSKQSKRLEAKWYSPPHGWLKISFDGVAKGNPGPVGCGAILRDENGICKEIVVVPIGCQTN